MAIRRPIRSTPWPGYQRWAQAAVAGIAIVVAGCAASPSPSPSLRAQAQDAPATRPPVVSPSPSAGAGAASPAASSDGSSSPSAPSAPSAPAAPETEPLLIYALKGRDADPATTETISTLDLATGDSHIIGRLPVDSDACCPTKVVVSANRDRAFLYSLSLRGIVDLNADTIARRPRGIQPYSANPNHAGDRVAWIDDVAADRIHVVVTTLEGREVARLPLPKGTWGWQERPEWSPDDRTLLVKALQTLDAAGVDAHLAVYGCCSTHGPSATHLFAVPVDGSHVTDVADDSTAVRASLSDEGLPAPPELGLTHARFAERGIWGARWSPDGSSIAYVDRACWYEARGGFLRDRVYRCFAPLVVVDTTTGAQTTITDGSVTAAGPVWSPDGRRILFSGAPVDGSGRFGLYVVEAGGGTPSRLIDTDVPDVGEALDDAGTWSPDGAWIAFERLNAARPEGTDRLDAWVMRADGSDARLIAKHAIAAW